MDAVSGKMWPVAGVYLSRDWIRNLVDSQCTLLSLDRDDCSLAIIMRLLEPGYADLLGHAIQISPLRTRHSKKIAISCRE